MRADVPLFSLPHIARILRNATRSPLPRTSALLPNFESSLFHKRRLPKGFAEPILFALLRRAVAQLGSALEWGSRGREFESRRPDHFTVSSLVSIGFSWFMDVE